MHARPSAEAAGNELTPLQRELRRDVRAERPTPLTVFEVARQMFNREHRLEMGELAAQAGVSRATLNRWVGSRNTLLGEILCWIADRAFTQAEHSVAGSGAGRVVDVLETFFAGVREPGPFRAFVLSSPRTALLLCTSNAGPVQSRVISRIEALLHSEGVAGDDTDRW
jgi:AcrR family transcriptional regulator